MYHAKLISVLLSKLSVDMSGGKCGLDDEELEKIENDLNEIDCGRSNEELKKAVAAFEALPRDKRIEIAEKLVNRKLYEEDIIDRYGISRPTMFRWIKKGKLHPFHIESGHKNYLYALEADESVRRYESEHQ